MQIQESPARPSGSRATTISVAAILVAAISFAATLYLGDQLRRAQRAVAPLQPFLIESVGPDGTIRSEVTIPAGTPIQLDVPIDERVAVRIDTILPIRTRVTVPIRSPIGSWDVPVPISADVPIRMVLPLRLDHTFELRTKTTEPIVVPIELN